MGFARRLSPDEIGHTQRGNNNAYCQDNEISWIKWDESNAEKELIALKVITLRRNHPVFRRRNFFQGRAIKGAGVKDILWLRPDGPRIGVTRRNKKVLVRNLPRNRFSICSVSQSM
jgi:isoamylase